MSLPTYQEAIDEISAFFYNAWSAGTTSIVGYIPKIFWDGQEESIKPYVDKFHVRFKIKSTLESQVTLQGNVDGGGARRYNNKGFVMIDIYSPVSQSNHIVLLNELSVLSRDAFRGKRTASGVVFNNATIKNIGAVDTFYNNIVISDYNYDTIG